MYTTEIYRRLCWAGSLALLSLSIGGCGGGPKIVPVSGQVFLNDEPLAAGVDGFVRIEPVGSRAATGKIDGKDGTFTLTTFEKNDGCLVGTHAVAVIVNATAGSNTISLIPEKYRESKTSELTVTIDGPTDSLRIELSGELKKAPSPPATSGIDDPGPT